METLVKLVVVQLVKTFSVLCLTRRFIVVLHELQLNQILSICPQSISSHSFFHFTVYFSVTPPSTSCLSQVVFFLPVIRLKLCLIIL